MSGSARTARERAEKALRTPDLEWARDLVHGLARDVLALDAENDWLREEEREHLSLYLALRERVRVLTEALEKTREAIRQTALAVMPSTTGLRTTFVDGYSDGLWEALRVFDAALSVAPPSPAAEETP